MRNLPPPPEIPGRKIQGPDLHFLRREVANLLKISSTRFPGAQPVSFSAKHLRELQKKDYYVCEKSDGVRCLMYLTSDKEGNEATFLIDRKNDYYHVPYLHFPLEDNEQGFHTNTIVDGELVNDLRADGYVELKYLVFDCLVQDRQLLMERILDKRLGYFREKVYKPFSKLFEKYPEEKQFLPFIMEFKKMERAYGMTMIFNTILPNLPHGNDGLIFTCRNTPYKPGTDPNIMKWKPADENSVDFRLCLEIPERGPDSDDEREGNLGPFPDYDAMPIFHLKVGVGNNQDAEWGQMYMTDEEWENLKSLQRPLDEAIVECYQDSQHRWRFMRFRDDKWDPNHITTVNSVIESIQDRIGEAELIAIQTQVRDAWKAREAKDKAELERAKKQNGSIGALPSHALPTATATMSEALPNDSAGAGQ
jgi:mRNA guanylyltransferase